MRYFITGGCGFIGSHLAEELAKDGNEIVIYDNLSTGYLKNIEHIHDKISFIKGDIRDKEFLTESMKNSDYVFHEAAIVSVFSSVEDPEENHSVNITGMLNVLLAARENGIKRLISPSSAAVYGNDPVLPKTETMIPCPESPYGMAKITNEYYNKLFYNLYGLETVTLRCFNVYGPRQDPGSMYSGVISIFADRLKNNKVPVIYGDGLQTRDFVFVKDVVKASIIAMHSANTGKGEIINISSGKEISLNRLLEIMNKIMGTDIEPEYSEARKGDVKYSVASIERAREILGYEPDYSIEEGLEALLKNDSR